MTIFISNQIVLFRNLVKPKLSSNMKIVSDFDQLKEELDLAYGKMVVIGLLKIWEEDLHSFAITQSWFDRLSSIVSKPKYSENQTVFLAIDKDFFDWTYDESDLDDDEDLYKVLRENPQSTVPEFIFLKNGKILFKMDKDEFKNYM